MSCSDESPVFVVSAPRSGSTLFRLVLDAHPNIAVPPPAWLYELIRPYAYSYGDPLSEEGFREMCEDIVSTPTIRRWKLGIDAETLAEQSATKDFKGAFALLHRAYGDQTGKSRWGEKSPRDSFWMDEILADFPDAQFIHIVRDGRDMAIDIADSPKMRPYSIYAGAHMWKSFLTAIRDSARRLSAQNFYEIKYESLCADPEGELKRVCDFLREDYSPQMLNHHASRQAADWSTDSQHAKSGRPITSEFCEMYKKRLGREDIGRLESVFSDLLAAYGYPCVGSKAVPERLAGQLLQSDIPTSPDNYEFKAWLAQRRMARQERGLYRVEDRDSLLLSPQ